MYTDVTGRTPRAVALSVTMGQRIELKARAKVSQEGADMTDQVGFYVEGLKHDRALSRRPCLRLVRIAIT